MRRGFPQWAKLVGMVVFLGGAAVTPLAAQTVKIGFIDLQKILVESKRGKDVLSKLQTEKEAKQREIEAQEKEIRQVEAELEKQRSVLSESARREKESAIRKRVRELRRTVEDFNRDFRQRERDLQNQMFREIAAVVKTYGKEKGYLLITEKRAGGVMYGSEVADLTNEVIAAYNASVGSAKR
ncbi:MAG: OmpH family outer membrane protein [Candidatus Methylomirabilales bacterium]